MWRAARDLGAGADPELVFMQAEALRAASEGSWTVWKVHRLANGVLEPLGALK